MKIVLGVTQGFSKAGYGMPALLKSAETPGNQKYFPSPSWGHISVCLIPDFLQVTKLLLI